MSECVQARVYESRQAETTVKSVVFQPESDLAARMFGLKGLTPPGLPTTEDWRRAVRQELGGDDVDFVLGDRRIVVRDGKEVVAEHQISAQDGVPVDVGGFYTVTGLLDLIARENQSTFDLLVQQLRSPMGVVPFGAGLRFGREYHECSGLSSDA